MDKKTIRRKGILYRTSLSQETVNTKSNGMNIQLHTLLQSLSEPYLTYTALLPGELNTAGALEDSHAVFIQPNKSAPMPTVEYPVIIIPMVAADTDGNRIGMGGGWFDRFLITQTQAVIIGCCYDQMVVDHVPFDNHDIRVDYICTETKTIKCSVE